MSVRVTFGLVVVLVESLKGSNVIDPKKTAQMDQDIKLVAESWPPLWRGIYQGCIDCGFSKEESFELLKVYVNTTCRNNTK